MYTYHPHSIVLLTSRFRYPDRRLFFTRARLFFDRIELSGWDFGKKHERAIPLDDVDQIDWEEDTCDVILHLAEGSSLTLRLSEQDSWKHLLEHRLAWNATNYTNYTTTTTAQPQTSTTHTQPLHELITFASSMG